MRRTLFMTAAVLLIAAAAAAQDPERRPVRAMGKLLKVEGKDFVIAARGPGGVTTETRVTLDEDDSAVILEGRPASLADLKPGLFVDVAEVPSRPAPGQARFRVAAQVAGFSGTVVRAEENRLVVKVRDAGGAEAERTVETDGKTDIRGTSGATAKLADLRPGTRVYVKPETGTATRINALRPRATDGSGPVAGTPVLRRVPGTLVKVDGKAIVVSPSAGGSPRGSRELVRGGPAQRDGADTGWTFATDDNTQISVDGERGRPEDLKPGMQVTVAFEEDGKPARSVTGLSPGLGGVVARVEGGNVILRATDGQEPGKELTVATDTNTKVIFVAGIPRTPKTPTVADLQPEMRVSVIPGTGVARKIIVLLKPQVQPQL